MGNSAANAIFLTKIEMAAFAVLLVALTGQNFSTIANAPAVHHRTGTDQGTGAVLIDLIKPRRGKYRAHMTVPLQTVVPPWLPPPEDNFRIGHKELLSPLGVFLVLLEITEPARKLGGSDNLFAWRGKGTRFCERGVRFGIPDDAGEIWSNLKSLAAVDGKPLRLDWHRLRLTHVQQRNQPVAQTRQTLERDYLIKDRGDLSRYQQIVATTLDERVVAAKDAMRLHFLTDEDLREAIGDPEAVASRVGVSSKTLRQLLEGRLDTVLTACSNNENGPYSPGRPCEASFLLCAGCPCAVALPRHLTVQVATHDALLVRKADTSPLDWIERFGSAWARLADLLDRHLPGAVHTARQAIDDDTRALVERLLNRELDT